MFNKRVVALCGRGQSGKSTSAEIFQEYGYSKRALADPLKKMLLAMGVHWRNLYGTNEEKSEPLDMLMGKSARYAMQMLGTEWRDLLGKELWLHHLDQEIANCSSRYIVVDDLRHDFEYEYFLKRGGIVIGITRPGHDVVTNAQHSSEQWNFSETGMPIIVNDGSRENLRQKLKAYL